ncbi:hypothetical protein [Rhodococcus opacus]|uniref:Putative aminopeptidase n=1 Tax=Rhodococcus opacus (strain B4) TaxID=632772 RepID=C1ARJ6_RHOOB|nr:hypothetical protein [Rhodococcus opacus]BAH48673.1 putative aminopeptidase [Rhodococcus opacus B4]
MVFPYGDLRPFAICLSARTSAAVALAFALLIGGSAPLSAALPTLENTSGGDGGRATLHFGPCSAITGTDDLGMQGLECGTLLVPLSSDDPGAGTVHLAVSRLRATDPAARRGMLLVNPGGPGGAGLEYAATKGAKLPQRVLAAYDIIGFDPRGIGHSVVSRPNTGQPPSSLNCGPMGGNFDRPVPPTKDLTALPALAATAGDCAAAIGPHAADFGT